MVVRRGVIGQLLVMLCCLSALTSTQAQTLAHTKTQTLAAAAPANQSLLTLWFALQGATQVQPPYAWIRPQQTAAQQSKARTLLLAELQQLAQQHATLAPALAQWQQHIMASNDWREPGHWGPAMLMTHDRKGVPLSALAAIGACQVPNWIELWSAQGVTRLPWQPRMHLHALLSQQSKSHNSHTDWVTLVWPWGEQQTYGNAAWNLDDTELLPGTRVLLTLPIDPQAARQLTHALADYLAHLLPGDHCGQLLLEHKAEHAPN